jgi:hypothetical protein
LEEVPRRLRKEVGIAIAAAEEKNQSFLGQFLDRMLYRVGNGLLKLAGISNHAVSFEFYSSSGSDQAATPIAKGVAIRRDGHERLSCQDIRDDNVSGSRKMHIHEKDHRYRLWTIVEEFETNL